MPLSVVHGGVQATFAVISAPGGCAWKHREAIRLTLPIPYFAISASKPSITDACALSASINTAKRHVPSFPPSRAGAANSAGATELA